METKKMTMDSSTRKHTIYRNQLNQLQQNTDAGDHFRGVQMLHQPYGTLYFDSTLSQHSEHMQQMVYPYQQIAQSQNKFNCLSASPKALLQSPPRPDFQEKSHIRDQSWHESYVQDALCQPITLLDEAQQHHAFSVGSISAHTTAARSTKLPQNSSGATCGPGVLTDEQQYFNQQRWLLLLTHARGCSAPEGKCQEVNCITMQRLLKHLKICKLDQCSYPRCVKTKILISHHKNCSRMRCPVCVPVNQYLKLKAHARLSSDSSSTNSMCVSWKSCDARHLVRLSSKTYQSMDNTSEDVQSSSKRLKTEHITPSSLAPSENVPVAVPRMDLSHVSQDAPDDVVGVPISVKHRAAVVPVSVKHKAVKRKSEPHLSSRIRIPKNSETRKDVSMDRYTTSPDAEPIFEPPGLCKQEEVVVEKEVVRVKQEETSKLPAKHTGMKSGKPNAKATSLTNTCNTRPDTESIFQLPGLAKQEAAVAEKDIVRVKQDEASNLPAVHAIEMKLGKPKLNATSPMNSYNTRLDAQPIFQNELPGLVKQEAVVVEKEIVQVNQETNQETANLRAEHGTEMKSGKTKIKGISLMELFTPYQIREHIISLRTWVGKSKAKAEKNQAMERSMSSNSCQLCAVEKLAFEAPPMYCTQCCARIKRKAAFYAMGSGDTRHYLCIPCYSMARGDTVNIDGTDIPKAAMEKKKNDEEIEEWWVQCDKCEAWQHQICALFNGRRNDGGTPEYTCPNCCIKEIERGESKPLPQSSVLGAKDLPRTILSDHIEQRLLKRLKQERLERAMLSGKKLEEVPGAEDLVLRVVSSVDKILEVKQHFLEIFQEQNYPKEFPYKSKAILLFQNIEGVEVCLFGMYVQEFGSDCQFPNQRRVYISYLDSVKYFRPEIRTVSGEALRTFVYHEILIGYLDYCKSRGFTSCYIWACPPLKGEDYILYSHPEIQKTPKSDKLREWYLSMLQKAMKENIVVELTNLYDHFFVSTDECKAKITAARLPYFDGDYWPDAAEDMVSQLSGEDGKKQHKKGKTKTTITRRDLKAAYQSDLSGNASKDNLLMQKIGDSIARMKDDFIMVHLQHSCTRCHQLMVTGNRWVCNKCRNFQLCDKCRDAEQTSEQKDKHGINSRHKHVFQPIEVEDVPADTNDKDEILESEFFDTRHAFLGLCQGNHYQYDTLRRAKHSSMMVLYHLHNPTAPAFMSTCNVCHNDVDMNQGWRCEICPDYTVCNTCFQKRGGVDHPHKLKIHPSTVGRDARSKGGRQKQITEKLVVLVVHASKCSVRHCPYPNCNTIRRLFSHGRICKTRAAGGCEFCKKVWNILDVHARACKESNCKIPRCKDLKEHVRRAQQQLDSRRRAAVLEMMRQRAAEVAGNSG